jgi:sugar phosphate permease
MSNNKDRVMPETKTSQEQMQTIFSQLKIQTCLLGGWAVYYLVNENFEKARPLTVEKSQTEIFGSAVIIAVIAIGIGKTLRPE